MKHTFLALALVAGACAPQQAPTDNALAIAYDLHMQCLAAGRPEQCETTKARFEAARAYSETATRRDADRAAARPPLVLSTYQPPTTPAPVYRPGITCTTHGNMTFCN